MVIQQSNASGGLGRSDKSYLRPWIIRIVCPSLVRLVGVNFSASSRLSLRSQRLRAFAFVCGFSATMPGDCIQKAFNRRARRETPECAEKTSLLRERVRDDTRKNIPAGLIPGGLLLADLTVVQDAHDSDATHDITERCRKQPVQVGSRGDRPG
jgi:hypothetical protein